MADSDRTDKVMKPEERDSDFHVPPERPHGQGKESLFTQAGPVHLGAGQRGIVALGGISRGGGSSHLDTAQSQVSVSTPPAPIVEPQAAPAVPAPSAVSRPVRVESRASGATSWSPKQLEPKIDSSAYIHPSAVVIGNVIIGARVFVAPGVIIRGDNEEPIYIGEKANLQEGVVIRDLPTRRGGKVDEKRLVEVGGKKFSVYIGDKVSICAQAQVHGPARVETGVYMGMQSLIFWARLGEGVVVEPACLIMNVSISPGVFVPAGLKVTNQKTVKELPPLTAQYRFYGIGAETSADAQELLSGYGALNR